jgi:CHAT domain-containing protein
MTEAARLKFNGDVVIISACNSSGEIGIGGEGFDGMARSFLFAGSRTEVASHWQVDSKATKMLIESYGKYLKTKGRLEAL